MPRVSFSDFSRKGIFFLLFFSFYFSRVARRREQALRINFDFGKEGRGRGGRSRRENSSGNRSGYRFFFFFFENYFEPVIWQIERIKTKRKEFISVYGF